MPNRHNASVATTNRLILDDPAKLKKFFEAIAMGMSIPSGAAYAELSPNTIKKWLKQARKLEPDGDYLPDTREYALLSFLKRYRESKAIFEAKHLGSVAAASEDKEAPGDWRAASWLLERRKPREYNNQFLIERAAAPMLEEFVKDLAEFLSPSARDELREYLASGGNNIPPWAIRAAMNPIEEVGDLSLGLDEE